VNEQTAEYIINNKITIKTQSEGLENCNSLKLMGQTDMSTYYKDFLFTGTSTNYNNNINWDYDKMLNSNLAGSEALTKM